MRILSKSEAFALLALYRKELLGGSEQCVMCALANRATRDNVVFEDRVCRVLLDRLGNRLGHLMVVPKRHAERFTDLGFDDYRALQDAVFLAARALEHALEPRRVFVASTGASDELPMSFPHFHVHVIPVYESDDRARPANVLSWTEGVVAYDDHEASALCASIGSRYPNRSEPACVESGI